MRTAVFNSTTGNSKVIQLPDGMDVTLEDFVRAAGVGLWNPSEHIYRDAEGEVLNAESEVYEGDVITATKQHSNGSGGTVTFISTTADVKVVEVPGPTPVEDVVRAVGLGTFNTDHSYSVDGRLVSNDTVVYPGSTIVASKRHSNGQ